MKSTSDAPRNRDRRSRSVVLRARRLAVAAVTGAAVVVAASSQVGTGTLSMVPEAVTGSATSSTESTAPTNLPQPGTVAAAEPSLKDAVVARGSAARAVAAVGSATDADVSDIPGPALAAYQRSAAVIGKAMPSCNLDWELVAAIGRIESDHGRFGGSSLNARGVAVPAIVGVALTGRDSTQRITDTDAGQLDGDKKLDRAVGPLQFLPTTWSVVGVDADGDGERDPQDIDDAALAAAVYLCGDGGDLSTEKGQKAAVYSYNRSDSYVASVLDLMTAYEQGEPTPIAPSVQAVRTEAVRTETAPAPTEKLSTKAEDTSEEVRVEIARDAKANAKANAVAARRGGDTRNPDGRLDTRLDTGKDDRDQDGRGQDGNGRVSIRAIMTSEGAHDRVRIDTISVETSDDTDGDASGGGAEQPATGATGNSDSNGSPAKVKTGRTKPGPLETAATKTKTVPAETATATAPAETKTKTAPAETKTAPTKTKTDETAPTKTKTETAPTETAPTETETAPTETAPTETETAPTETAPTETETAPTEAEIAPSKAPESVVPEELVPGVAPTADQMRYYLLCDDGDELDWALCVDSEDQVYLDGNPVGELDMLVELDTLPAYVG